MPETDVVERQIIDAIEAQFDIHAMEPEDFAEMWCAISRALEHLRQEIARRDEALSFYACDWVRNSAEMLDDRGRRARHALGTLIENVDEHIDALNTTERSEADGR